MSKVIVLNAFLTAITAEQPKQWARVNFADPASGKDGYRLFEANMLAAYSKGDVIEGPSIQVMESAPYKFEDKTLNKRTVVILNGESEVQALARSFGKNTIPAHLQTSKEATKVASEPAIK